MADAFARTVQRAPSVYAVTFRPDEVYRVPTDDGSSIALGRYRPRTLRRVQEPVILCHGLGANRFNLDLDERHSLARYLANRGFETWVMELRGRGLAGPPVETCFDDQAEYDVRAALRTVRSTGAEAVTWVGHSKGGLLAFAHLARNPQAPIRAVAALGSPLTFKVQPGLKTFLKTIAPLLRLKVIPASRLAALAPLGPVPSPLTRYLMLEENVDVDVVKRALANIASDIAGGVARQFVRWIEQGTFDSRDGSFDYRKQMLGIRAPVLLVAGSRDLLAPPLSVARAQEVVSGPVKTVVAGRAHGFEADYGHSDLAIGRHAPDEIYPLVETFLVQHSSRL